MSKVTLLFIIASLFYLCVGVTIGVVFTVHTNLIGFLAPMHAHTNLLGWVSMMIFAVAYHVLPRFSGRPLYSETLANLHLIFANVGLLGLIIVWPLLRVYGTVTIQAIHIVAALFYAIGAFLFVINISKTVLARTDLYLNG